MSDSDQLPARRCETCRHWQRTYDGTVPHIPQSPDGICWHPDAGPSLRTTDLTVCTRWERKDDER